MAADFWQKPYTEWSDKDVTKMMTNSPWAKTTAIPLAGPLAGPDIAPPGGGGGGGGGGGRGGGGGGGGGGPEIPASAGGGSGTMDITVRWQSAVPVRQAFVRQKFGAEATTSADAKKILDEEATDYEIVLTGPIQPFLRGKLDDAAKMFGQITSLSSGKNAMLKPTRIEIARGPKSVDVRLFFSRSKPFVLEDKEVEFATTVGFTNLKYKFKLKDMVSNGKLEM